MTYLISDLSDMLRNGGGRRSDFGNRLASPPLVGWKIAKRRRRRNRQLISLAAADATDCVGGSSLEWRRRRESDDDVCVSERRKRRGFLLKQTSRLDGAGMREKLRSRILVRAVGLFCSATATGPTGGEQQANDMPKAWPASEGGKAWGEGHAHLHSPS